MDQPIGRDDPGSAGGSSYIWARKHNSIHHSLTNITGQDDDIDVGFLGRLSPHQRRLRVHRFQHLYLWVLYGFLAIKWHLVDDFRDVLTGRIGQHRFPRPRGRDLVMFLGGKAVFFTLAFGLPLLLHPWWIVLTFYGLVSFVEGVVLSVVFQLAHCVEEASFRYRAPIRVVWPPPGRSTRSRPQWTSPRAIGCFPGLPVA